MLNDKFLNKINKKKDSSKSMLKTNNADLLTLNGGNELTNTNNTQSDLILLNPISSTTSNTTTNIDLNDPNNLDDRYSVISDSAAWSTDLITNSDSDLESNSPSKYVYSRTNSFQNSDYNSSTFQLNNQPTSSLPPSILNNFANNASFSSAPAVNADLIVKLFKSNLIKNLFLIKF